MFYKNMKFTYFSGKKTIPLPYPQKTNGLPCTIVKIFTTFFYPKCTNSIAI